MLDSQVLAFIILAAVLTVTPGADTMLVFRNVLRGGRRFGFVTTIGICSGLLVHAIFSGLGLSLILMHSATAYTVVKFAGAAYLVWLGVQSLRSATRSRTVEEPHERGESGSIRGALLEGLLSNVLNPKVAVFYLAFLPQFIGPEDPVLLKSMVLATIHFVMGLAWLGLLSWMLDHGRTFLLRDRVRRWMEGLVGAVLIGFAAALALEKR